MRYWLILVGEHGVDFILGIRLERTHKELLASREFPEAKILASHVGFAAVHQPMHVLRRDRLLNCNQLGKCIRLEDGLVGEIVIHRGLILEL